MSQKKLILIASTALVLIFVVLLYFFPKNKAASEPNSGGFFGGFFGSSGDRPTSGDGAAGTQENPPGETVGGTQGTQKLVRISGEPVVGATTIPRDGKVKYFKKSSGHLFQNAYDGSREERISNVTIPAILDVQWSDSKNAVALSYYDGGALKRYYFQYTGTTTKSSGFLPDSIDTLAMSDDEDKIIYSAPVGAEYAIVTALPDNSGRKTIFSTKVADFEVVWPDKNIVSLKTKTSAFAESHLFTLNPANGSFVKILGDMYGFDVLWSPDAKRFLYSQTRVEGGGLTLSVYNRTSGQSRALDFATLPEKCLWSERETEVLYCAIPQSMPERRLPDDWWLGRISFDDSIWKINTQTGAKQQLMSVYAVDAVKIFISPDEQYLFFINKKDDSLWSLRLKP